MNGIRVALPVVGEPCPHCGGPVKDLYAERVPGGSRTYLGILERVPSRSVPGQPLVTPHAIDCYYCRGPLRVTPGGELLAASPSLPVLRRDRSLMVEAAGGDLTKLVVDGQLFHKAGDGTAHLAFQGYVWAGGGVFTHQLTPEQKRAVGVALGIENLVRVATWWLMEDLGG